MVSTQAVASLRPSVLVSGSTPVSAATARAIQVSRAQLVRDLEELLQDGKRRFADVSWKVEELEDEVYHGHRAILYGRGTGAFQMKYLNPHAGARLEAIMSGSTLTLPNTTSIHARASSPASSVLTEASQAVNGRSPLSLPASEAAFFKALLEYLYTGKTDMSDVFGFLFDTSDLQLSPEEALDKLSQDLLFVWRSKLFADVKLQIAETAASIPSQLAEGADEGFESAQPSVEDTVFSAHKAILCSRCPYFASMLLSPYSDSDSALFVLPSPPFSPAALHFTLGYIYTGSLSLNRSFDLAVGMDIWRASQYLSMDLLRDELECRFRDMCHDYRGCCKTCRQRAVRLFAFSQQPDVQSKSIQDHARPIVLDHFGETWNQEVGELGYSVQKDLIVDLCAKTTAATAADIWKGICQTRTRIATERAPWAEHLRSMLSPLEDRIKHLVRKNFAEIAVSKPFVDLLEGVGFSNDILESLLSMLVASLSEKNAPTAYENLVGKVLLREEGITMDARVRTEDARQAIIAYIKKRWASIRINDGFEPLENWSLKELSDELEVPVQDLLQPSAASMPPTTKTGLRMASTKVHKVENEAYSTVSGFDSLRASILNRNAARKSSATSLASSPRITPSTSAKQSLAGAPSTSSPPVNRNRTVSAPRAKTPTAKTAAGPSVAAARPPPPALPLTSTTPTTARASEVALDEDAKEKQTASVPSPVPPLPSAAPPANSASIRSPASSSTPNRTSSLGGPKSTTSVRSLSAPSVRGKASSRAEVATTSKVRSASPSASTQGASTRTGTATPPAVNSRSPSTQSKVGFGTRTTSLSTPTRAATVTSVRSTSTVSPKAPASKAKATPTSQPADRPSTVAPTVASKRPSSAHSIKSTTSTRTTTSRTTLSPKAGTTSARKPAVPPVPNITSFTPTPTLASKTKPLTTSLSPKAPFKATAPGSALNVGIPCVVTSGPAKFKATVRYLGEVLFDSGTFVGVEVSQPSAEEENEENATSADLVWNDGSVDGVRYFELESQKPVSPLLTELQAKADRRASGQSHNGRATPVPPSTPGITKGLFVRPAQVLFVF